MNDEVAIQRLKKGELAGMDDLVLKYQDKAIRTAYLITRNDDMAKDAVQETFLRIYQRIHNFDESRPFEPYLLRSVVNTALNMAEKVRKEVSLGEELTPLDVGALISKAASTESQVEYAQLKEQIQQALEGLPPRERAVIVERYYLGMSEKEMAGLHAVAPGTVKWILNAARNRLRTFIGTENDQP
jgi:RNA polymerase sigma-70 factor, ECF subfamily